MRRFMVEHIRPEGGTVRVTGPEARHMTRVLRMVRGDRVVLMDETGARWQAVIQTVGKDEASLLLERNLPAPEPSPLEITVCPALLKSRAMDLLIQKASELGAARIRPVVSQRSTAQLEGRRLSSRLRHWKEIARSAAKQADRATPARVDAPVPLQALLLEWSGRPAARVLLWESEEACDLRGFLRDRPAPAAAVAVVGPEGGFHPEEVEMASRSGFQPVSLGRRVLRAETAVLTVTALLQYEWGDLSGSR